MLEALPTIEPASRPVVKISPRITSMSELRRFSLFDRAISRASEVLMAAAQPASRPVPGGPVADARDAAVAPRSIEYMRINHAGEVAAQALYHGQALTARNGGTRAHLLAAAAEEKNHLAWCEARLSELDARPSRLTPFWYAGSFAIGAVAGLAGDRWSLGFVEETERQVSAHLDAHIKSLADEDDRSRAILEQMRIDEERHGREAGEAGARELPQAVKTLMRRVAKIMKWAAPRF